MTINFRVEIDVTGGALELLRALLDMNIAVEKRLVALEDSLDDKLDEIHAAVDSIGADEPDAEPEKQREPLS